MPREGQRGEGVFTFSKALRMAAARSCSSIGGEAAATPHSRATPAMARTKGFALFRSAPLGNRHGSFFVAFDWLGKFIVPVALYQAFHGDPGQQRQPRQLADRE